MQASLSTYLQKEWLSQFQDTGLSAKALLKVYQDYFEPDDKKVNGEPPKGSGAGGGRGRGRSRGGKGSRGALPFDGQVQRQVPDVNAGNHFTLFYIPTSFET